MQKRVSTHLVELFVFVLMLGGCTKAPMSWMVETPLTESGTSVKLEVVLFRPSGSGPFPLVLFNHGSTGRGDNPALFAQTWAPESVADFFVRRGWMVAFPQRRGRGKSAGVYDEGFTPDRTRYSCDPRWSLPGVDRALEDIDAAYHVVVQRPDVDRQRVLVAGQSRGGILAIVFAGTRPAAVIGAINFVGGWMNERCEADAINRPTFQRGAAFPRPTLWLYGHSDPYYSLVHSRKNFDSFLAAGGKGVFKEFDVPGNGHALIRFPELWGPAVEEYVQALRVSNSAN
jgi:dienelactone hydrolase